GVSLSDVVATAMMLEMYSSHGSGQTFAYAESAMKAPLEKAIAQMEGTNVPFFQAIATKLGWWQHHLDGSYMEPYCDESAGSGMLVGSLKRNWTAILAKSCSFSQSSISTALNQIDTTINQLEGGQYQQLSQQLAQAEQAQSAMQNLLNGDWSIAFPSGPYVQGPTAPDGYFESIQDVIAALSKILLSQKSDPMVQQLLNQLWQVTSGPPYPATIVSTVQMIAQSYSAIHPLTADQKQMIQTAFTKMDQNIQAMTKRREDLTPLVQLFNAISKDLKGFPNCTAQNYEDAASLIWKLIQMDVGATDPAQSQMINKFFSTLMSSSPEMAGEMGILFYDAQLANGVKPSDLHDIMEQFQKSHPNLYKDCPFADKFVYQIIIDSHPPPSKSDPESTINSIKNIFSQPGSGQTYWSKISSQSQACQDEYNQLQQEITQQKEVEQELKSAFGGLN
nr:hypothetical protein [Chlamydiota bacterium]